MIITEEQRKQLIKARTLIGEVQIALTLADDQLPQEERTGQWRILYKVRCDLAAEIHRLESRKGI